MLSDDESGYDTRELNECYCSASPQAFRSTCHKCNENKDLELAKIVYVPEQIIEEVPESSVEVCNSILGMNTYWR